MGKCQTRGTHEPLGRDAGHYQNEHHYDKSHVKTFTRNEIKRIVENVYRDIQQSINSMGKH